MIAIANFALLFLLSLVNGHKAEHDPHGFHKFSRDSMIRDLALEGSFQEFEAAVGGFVQMRLAIDLSKAKGKRVSMQTVGSALKGSGDLAGLIDAINGAMKVAAFAIELKTLGPTKAAAVAVSWLESGLIRQSGLKPPAFPSYFGLLKGESFSALNSDILKAHSQMDSSYIELLGRLGESIL